MVKRLKILKTHIFVKMALIRPSCPKAKSGASNYLKCSVVICKTRGTVEL